MSQILSFLTAVDIVIDIPVTPDAGNPWQTLDGVTIEARAALNGVGAGELGNVSVTDMTITVAWPEFTFTAGMWTLEVIGTKDGLTQQIETVPARFKVVTALKPAP